MVGVTGLMVLELGEGGAISLAARANATVIAVVTPQPTLATLPPGRAEGATVLLSIQCLLCPGGLSSLSVVGTLGLPLLLLRRLIAASLLCSRRPGLGLLSLLTLLGGLLFLVGFMTANKVFQSVHLSLCLSVFLELCHRHRLGLGAG